MGKEHVCVTGLASFGNTIALKQYFKPSHPISITPVGIFATASLFRPCKWAKGTKSYYKCRKVTTIIIMPNVFFRFGTNFAFPIFFEILSISQPVFIYSLHHATAPLFGHVPVANANAAKKVFFLSNPMSLLAIECMNV